MESETMIPLCKMIEAQLIGTAKCVGGRPATWSELAKDIAAMPEIADTRTAMKIVIVLEGGMVQHVVTSEPMEVVVIDYDTDGADQDELTAVPQDKGDPADAYVTMPMVDVNAVRAEELIALA